MLDIKAKAREVYEQGFCVLDGVYRADECEEMRKVLDRVWEKRGHPPLTGFGIGIHPLLQHAPEMAPFFAKGVVIDTIAEVFRDDVRLAHSGARISNEESIEFLGWHYHCGDWNLNTSEHRSKVERVLCNVYVDGLSDGVGPLLVYPRKVDDSLTPPYSETNSDWPGQVVVACSLGSAVIFDVRVFHAAKRGKGPGLRHLWGGHYQGWNNLTPHREDNSAEGTEIEMYKKQFPIFRKLVEPRKA